MIDKNIIGYIILTILFTLMVTSARCQDKPRETLLLSPTAVSKAIQQPDYKLGAGIYYSRSTNEWNGNRWNGNTVSLVVHDNRKWTPNLGVWYDPITKARGIFLSTKVVTIF